MPKISFDDSKLDTMFDLLDIEANKKLDSLVLELNKAYDSWKPIIINELLDFFVFEDPKKRENVAIVLKHELIPKLVYDKIYILTEKFRKSMEKKTGDTKGEINVSS